MSEKIYYIENLDCAHCAAKVEAAIRKIPGVEEAIVVFALMQLRLTADDPDNLLEEVTAVARQIEPDIRFLAEKQTEETHCHGQCHCQDHEAYHPKESKNTELTQILVGAALFLLGVLLEQFVSADWLHGVVFVGAYLLLGFEILQKAGKNLLRGKALDENFLMSIATLGAFAIGNYPEAVGVMLFFRVGEYFEHRAMERSRSQIMEAVDLRPDVVNLVSGEEIKVIPAENVKSGDLLLVRPGDRIPIDGVVVSGESRIDTAAITGESVPVTVRTGDSVTSGCVNTAALLTIRAEKLLSESMVSRILRSVENAAASKPKMDRFLTRFARIYTPVMVIISLTTAVIPSLIWGSWHYWVYTALSFLVMSCPCALVLSVPLAFFSGIGAGSKKGILFKSGLSIEALAQVKAVVMDKTGTITKGEFTVQKVPRELLAICASCEQNSTHPIAHSIVAAAAEQGIPLGQPERQEEISGCGVRAVLDGAEILCGNEKLMKRFGVGLDEETADTYGTRVLVARNGKLLGQLFVADTLKTDAKEAVAQLKKQSVKVAVLTGDRENSAKAVAAAVGIEQIYAGLLPEEKLQHLQQIRSRWGSAMFVGDGINDAPVLAGADVGAAMGSGADAAIEAADVVFLHSDVAAIPEALHIARKVQRIAWQNVVFALAVKTVVMVLGLLGWASMWAAVFADSGVAMLCVLNSVRILYASKK